MGKVFAITITVVFAVTAVFCVYAFIVNPVEEPPIVCEEGHVSIQGLDRVQLLHLLWLNQESRGFNAGLEMRWGDAKKENDGHARDQIQKGHIDYFMGRAIKMDLRDNCVNPVFYNRDTARKAEKTIAWLRSETKAAEARREKAEAAEARREKAEL